MVYTRLSRYNKDTVRVLFRLEFAPDGSVIISCGVLIVHVSKAISIPRYNS